MKLGTKAVIFLFFLLFFLKNALFAGTWTGAVTIVPVLALPDGEVSASLENCSYTTADPNIQQELNAGTATISYSYSWSASPDGTILTGQGTPSVTASFDEVSFGAGDKDIGCWVTCDITYGGQVMETSNEPFFECLTVFGVMIKDDNGWDDPNPYIPKGGSRGYYAVPVPMWLYGTHTFEWSVEDASPSGCVSPLEGSEQGFNPSGMSVGSATLKITFTPAGASDSAEDTFEVQVWRLDLVISGMNEATESDTGVFMPVGARKSLSIGFENGPPLSTTVTLSCNQEGKVSLWSGSQQINWGSTWSTNAIPSNLEIRGEVVSNSLRDISVSLTASKGGADTANVTVFSLSLSANPTTVCAGGGTLAVCKSDITATFHPAVAGKTINFAITSDRCIDSLYQDTYCNVGDSRGSLSSASATTDSNGYATVQLTSGADASNPEMSLYYFVGLKASFEDVETDTAWVEYDPPHWSLDAFLDPNNPTQYLDELASGDTALNRMWVSCDDTAIPNHTIGWKIKFWTTATLNAAALDAFQVSYFDDLTVDSQEYIFSNYASTYEGTGPSDYGEIDSESTADLSGMAESIYTAGTEEGYVYICAQDNNVLEAQREE